MLNTTKLGLRSTLKYIAALCLLAFLSIYSFILLSNQIKTNSNDAYYINLSGMQRMLSQRISLMSHEIYFARTVIEANNYANLMQQAVDRMADNHEVLSKEVELIEGQKEIKGELYKAYFDNTGINQSIELYLSNARQFLTEYNRPDSSKTALLASIQQTDGSSRDDLLEKVDHAVSIFQANTEEKIQLLEQLALLTLGSSLLFILLIGLFIFRPMVNQIIGHAASTQKIFDSAPNGMLMINKEGVIEMANKEAALMFEYDKHELEGKNTALIFPFPIQSAAPASKDNEPANPNKEQEGLFGVKKDGTKIAIDIALNPIQTPTGASIITIIVDATERIQKLNELEKLTQELTTSNEDLQRSNADLEQFAYVASHDLQEPLRMVSSYTQLLGSRYKGQLDENADKYIEFAVDGAKRMQFLIQDLLKYSRIHSTRADLADIDSNVLFDYACSNLDASIKESQSSLTKDTLPMVRGDIGQLRLLFQNAIGNAVKYHDPSKKNTVTVSAKANGYFWEFCVEDTGIGIKEEFFDKIFIIFKRLHLRSDYQGTGIGLTLCKTIVEKLGGQIWIKSELGKGSQLHFTLPKAQVGGESNLQK